MTAALLAGGLPLLALPLAVLLARGRLVAVTVRGYSMSPTLMPGDRVLVLRGRSRIAAGRMAVVTAPHPEHGWRPPAGAAPRSWYVKHVVAVAGDPVPEWAHRCTGPRVPPRMLVLLGEQPGSMDSKQWGYCPEDQVVGTVLLRLRAAAPEGAETGPPSR
ncbi:S26 family signal peptidase [Streptomyces indicus]|uniref:Signal peptidase I/basic amino acid/polyamine antiporter, APA family n=1 Tax=Streptomyces indicus TaxID=417292 RepID=A0A1G9G1A3_9ACTN|nr:S26 family signal peptidase [Streptomyces indicus]SDK94377.1 signal peptidase I/basic amino acid/polyamine antiporter, APA family [Streptomyces indicus]